MATKAPATHVEIYALRDPRDGAIRYIGKASNSARRLKEHMREVRRRTPLYDWIAKLRTEGLTPSMTVETICPIGEWEQAERDAIAKGRADGLRLLNLADGGDQPHCSTEVRSANAKALNARIAADPRKAKIRKAKQMLGHALRDGYVSEATKEKMRESARKAPHLFGEWAHI